MTNSPRASFDRSELPPPRKSPRENPIGSKELRTMTGEANQFGNIQQPGYNAAGSSSKQPRLNPKASNRIAGSSAMEDPAFIALRPLLEKGHPAIFHIDADNVKLKAKHGAGFKLMKGIGCGILATATLGTACCCMGRPYLVPDGSIAVTVNNGVPEFLAPGWHWMVSPFRKLISIQSLKENVISQGTKCIVTIPPGRVGYCTNEGEAILLEPGMHQWDHPTIQFVGSYDISEPLVEMGPYTLVTVREGECAVTRRNGVLEILGAEKLMGLMKQDEKFVNRTYLLNHQQWRFVAWLKTTEQFDLLKANELLTNDRVEVDLESTVAWRITDPVIAAKQGGGMDYIRGLVHREARATVSDLIMSTKMSAGIRPPESKKKSYTKGKGPADDSDAPLKEGDGTEGMTGGVSETAVDACSQRLGRIGVHVDTINIVQLNIQDRTIRERLAQAAVISTTVQEKAEIAKTEAKNVEVRAKADAEASRMKAKAQADSIEFIAEAEARAMRLHGEASKEAGELVESNTTSRHLEHIRVTGTALAGCNSTMFLTPGQNLSELMANPAVVQAGTGKKPVALGEGEVPDDDETLGLLSQI